MLATVVTMKQTLMLHKFYLFLKCWIDVYTYIDVLRCEEICIIWTTLAIEMVDPGWYMRGAAPTATAIRRLKGFIHEQSQETKDLADFARRFNSYCGTILLLDGCSFVALWAGISGQGFAGVSLQSVPLYSLCLDFCMDRSYNYWMQGSQNCESHPGSKKQEEGHSVMMTQTWTSWLYNGVWLPFTIMAYQCIS